VDIYAYIKLRNLKINNRKNFVKMLSRIFLLFDDSEMRNRYSTEKKDFYKKCIPIIAVMMALLAIAMEVIYRVEKYGDITIATSAINWSCLVAFIALAVLVHFIWWSCWFICPILTCLTYYYFAYIDYDRTSGIVYFR
jgi:hypothetical protein